MPCLAPGGKDQANDLDYPEVFSYLLLFTALPLFLFLAPNSPFWSFDPGPGSINTGGCALDSGCCWTIPSFYAIDLGCRSSIDQSISRCSSFYLYFIYFFFLDSSLLCYRSSVFLLLIHFFPSRPFAL
jgi:hypothetical protein